MKHVLLSIAILFGASMPSFAIDAPSSPEPAQPTEPKHVMPMETKAKGDVLNLESRMAHLLDMQDALQRKISALQKEIDAKQGVVDKLGK